MSTARKPTLNSTPAAVSASAEAAAGESPGNLTDVVRVTRRFAVKIEGSMNLIEQLGPMSATWAPAENTHAAMFGANFDTDIAAEHTNAVNSITNAVIVKAEMLESKSTFPVSLGLSCNVIPGQEVTDNGERFLATVLPMSSQNTPQTLYEADPKAQGGMEWRNAYPNYTKSNLETEGTMEVKNAEYLFVSQTHPAIDVIRYNPQSFQGNVSDSALIDNEWFKLTRETFSCACDAIKEDILSKVHTADLSAIQFQLHRFNGAPWTTLKNEEFCYDHNTPQEERAAKVQARMNMPCSYHARVQLTYELNRAG
jgi:hypothetical protein